MQDYISRLRIVVDRAATALHRLSDAESALRPGVGKWSPREVLGHLIDSASNNHQRFVRAQTRDDLVFEGYDQDAWVAFQRYQESEWGELVAFWRAYNLHIAVVMAATPAAVRSREVTRHNLDETAWRTIPAEKPATLDYFMRDYVDHLEHHLRQILGDDWIR